MKKSTTVLHNLFFTTVMTAVFCWFIQHLMIWQGNLEAFSWKAFFINYPIGFITGLICCFVLPAALWGMKLAEKCKALPDTWRYSAIVNAVVNTINTTILTIVMTYINVHIFNHAPLAAVVTNIVSTYIPVWLVAYLVSCFAVPLCRKLACRCTGDPY